MRCYENRYGPCLTTQTRTDGRKTGYYTRERSPSMARRVKLSIVKIGEFHTDTRFGKEEKKGLFQLGVAHFKTVCRPWKSFWADSCRLPSAILAHVLFPSNVRKQGRRWFGQLVKKKFTSLRIITVFVKANRFLFETSKTPFQNGQRNNSRFLTRDTLYKSAIYQVSQLLRQRQNVDNKWACQRVKNELLWHFWMNN